MKKTRLTFTIVITLILSIVMTGYGEDKDTRDVEFGHLFEMGLLDEAIAEAVETGDRIRENLQSTFSEKTAIYQQLYVHLYVAFNEGYLTLADPQSTVAEKAAVNRKLDVLTQKLDEVIAVAREAPEVRSGRYIALVHLQSIVVEKAAVSRKIDLLIGRGLLDMAIAAAVKTLDRTKGNPNANIAEKSHSAIQPWLPLFQQSAFSLLHGGRHRSEALQSMRVETLHGYSLK